MSQYVRCGTPSRRFSELGSELGDIMRRRHTAYRVIFKSASGTNIPVPRTRPVPVRCIRTITTHYSSRSISQLQSSGEPVRSWFGVIVHRNERVTNLHSLGLGCMSSKPRIVIYASCKGGDLTFSRSRVDHARSPESIRSIKLVQEAWQYFLNPIIRSIRLGLRIHSIIRSM